MFSVHSSRHPTKLPHLKLTSQIAKADCGRNQITLLIKQHPNQFIMLQFGQYISALSRGLHHFGCTTRRPTLWYRQSNHQQATSFGTSRKRVRTTTPTTENVLDLENSTTTAVEVATSSSSSFTTSMNSVSSSEATRSWASPPTFFRKPGVMHRTEDNILTVALVGRPNTGKSTLFNRLTKSKTAIVSNVPGTTRDRREGKGFLAGLPLNIIDTGGLDDRGVVSQQIQQQVIASLSSADVILFMLDAKVGLTALDNFFAKWLREKMAKAANTMRVANNTSSITLPKVLLLANKTEGAHMNDRVLDIVSESYSLGFGEPMLISATHGDGMSDLATSLIEIAQERGKKDMVDDSSISRKSIKKATETNEISTTSFDADGHGSNIVTKDAIKAEEKNFDLNDIANRTIQLAIMGRPNVGKSTLLNAFLGEDRVITGPTAGLTRDAIHVEWSYRDRLFRLVDTAGLTRLQTNKELLKGVKEQRNLSIAETIGKHVDKKIILPGLRELNPEEDPSQWSTQISEYALLSALQACKHSQVVMIVVESTQGKFNKVDLQLARHCLMEGRAVFIAANKCDQLTRAGVSLSDYEEQVMKHTEEFFREFGEIPVVACSGTKQKNLRKLLATAMEVHDSWSKRINTWVLNKWLKELMVIAPTARAGDKAVHIKYITQVKARPPTFALFANVTELPVFLERFLRSRLQKEFHLRGVPIRFIVKKSEGNAVKKHLLKQGKHSRRGTGLGEAKGRVGPNRDEHRIRKRYVDVTDERRRRDSRLRRQRSK